MSNCKTKNETSSGGRKNQNTRLSSRIGKGWERIVRIFSGKNCREFYSCGKDCATQNTFPGRSRQDKKNQVHGKIVNAEQNGIFLNRAIRHRSCRVTSFQERFFHQFFLFAGQISGDLHDHFDKEIAPAVRVQKRHALSPQAKDSMTLCAFGNF